MPKTPSYAQKLKKSLQQIPSSTSSPNPLSSPKSLSCTIETQVSSHVIEEENRMIQQNAIAEIKSILDSPEPVDQGPADRFKNTRVKNGRGAILHTITKRRL